MLFQEEPNQMGLRSLFIINRKNRNAKIRGHVSTPERHSW